MTTDFFNIDDGAVHQKDFKLEETLLSFYTFCCYLWGDGVGETVLKRVMISPIHS